MDSTVLQATPAAEGDTEGTQHEEGKFDDIGSSSNPNRDVSNVAHRRQHSSGQSSSDSGMPNPPSPVHNFFKVYTDTGAEYTTSDGSIAFNYNPPVAVQALSHNERSRFPSFDSIGSSGSVVRKVPPPRNSKPKTSSAPTGQQDAKILPYHERRKLMQQRQAQEQPKSAAPAPRPPASFAQPSFVMPPHPPFSQFPPPQMYPPFMPPQAYGMQPPPQGFVYPPPPLPPISIPHYPPFPPPPGLYPAVPIDLHQQPQPYFLPPDRGKFIDNDFSSVGGHRARAPREQNTGPQNARPPIQPLPPYQRNIHSNGILLASKPHRSMPTDLSYAASSSFDSSDGNNETRKDLTPPPPPPSLPPPATHVRNDSSGSVSSLGSIDRGPATEQQQHRQHQVRSFFDRISPWKAAPAPSKEHTVGAFHRKNQAFLSKIVKQNSPRSLTSVSPSISARAK